MDGWGEGGIACRGETRNARGTLAGNPTEKKPRGHIRAEENNKMGLRETGRNTWNEFQLAQLSDN